MMGFKSTKRVVYTDNDGLKWVYLVMESTEEAEWNTTGILIGPPDLSDLGLTKLKRKALQNELVSRGWLQAPDLKHKSNELAQLIKKLNLPNLLRRHILSVYQYAYYDA